MGAKTALLACPHCAAENTPTRDICFKCREPLHLDDGHAPPLPTIFGESSEAPPWMTRVWHLVTAPGAVLGPDGSRLQEIIVREIGTDSLVFDSELVFQPSEGLILEFELEGKTFRLGATARRTARTLGMDLAFATTVDLNEPGEEYVVTVSSMNPVDEKAWWD